MKRKLLQTHSKMPPANMISDNVNSPKMMETSSQWIKPEGKGTASLASLSLPRFGVEKTIIQRRKRVRLDRRCEPSQSFKIHLSSAPMQPRPLNVAGHVWHQEVAPVTMQLGPFPSLEVYRPGSIALQCISKLWCQKFDEAAVLTDRRHSCSQVSPAIVRSMSKRARTAHATA